MNKIKKYFKTYKVVLIPGFLGPVIEKIVFYNVKLSLWQVSIATLAFGFTIGYIMTVFIPVLRKRLKENDLKENDLKKILFNDFCVRIQI